MGICDSPLRLAKGWRTRFLSQPRPDGPAPQRLLGNVNSIYIDTETRSCQGLSCLFLQKAPALSVLSSTNTFICSECHVTEHRVVFMKDGRETDSPPMPMQAARRIKRAPVEEEHFAAPGLLGRVMARL